MKTLLFLAVALVSTTASLCQQKTLQKNDVHLRHGSSREWVEFPEKARDSVFTITFNAGEALAKVLSLIQYDVNHDWQVSLNGKRLGNLVVDEQKMLTYFDIPSGLLKETDNVIKIFSATTNFSNPDDIVISKLTLHKEVSFTAPVNITVVSNDQPIPSKLTILNADGAFQPVRATAGDTLAIRPGIIYSGTGNYSFSLPYGRYTIYASRGFEYGVDSTIVTVDAAIEPARNRAKSSAATTMNLTHEVPLKNWRSFDTHIHTQEYSGHGDATMKERVLTIAGEGLDYGVITEHNKAIDIKDTVEKMAMSQWFTPVTGNELTTSVGHFNMFPADAEALPSPDGITWSKVAELRKGKKQVVIFNHARDIHAGFRPADTMFSVPPGDFPSNAMEVMNSGSQQTDPRELYRDWLRLWSRGIKLSAIGSSDSHDVNRFIVGQGRTYVPADGHWLDHFLHQKTAVSFGLFTELIVDISRPGDKTKVVVQVHAPSWVKPATLDLYVNGEKIYSSPLSDRDKQVGNFYQQELNISLPQHEVTLVAVAEGPNPRVPWWPINKPYQHASPELNPVVMAISVPVHVK